MPERANRLISGLATLVFNAVIVAAGAGTATAWAADVEVVSAWARATPPGADTASLYLTLKSQSADKLVGLETAAAGMAMLHESKVESGVSEMRDVTAVDLPPGQAVTLRPGGMHVMLMGLTKPLHAGEHFNATLRFARASPVAIDVVVAPIGATSAP